jgi:signal peptidase I
MTETIQTTRPAWKVWRVVWWILKFAIAALVIALPIRSFVAQPILVSGMSMEPNLMPHEYLVVDKLWYHIHAPERGDVIVMRYPLDASTYFVKRIIGLPGETVSDNNGIVTVLSADGSVTVLDEPYVALHSDKKEKSTTSLAADEYFVLGDNREQSSDSRNWGPLQKKFIVGRAAVRLFPLSQLEILPGQYRFKSSKY